MAEDNRWGCSAITAPPLSKSCKSPTTEEAESQSVSQTPLSPALGCVKLGKRGICNLSLILIISVLPFRLAGGDSSVRRFDRHPAPDCRRSRRRSKLRNCHFWHFSFIVPNEEIKGKLNHFGFGLKSEDGWLSYVRFSEEGIKFSQFIYRQN